MIINTHRDICKFFTNFTMLNISGIVRNFSIGGVVFRIFDLESRLRSFLKQFGDVTSRKVYNF